MPLGGNISPLLSWVLLVVFGILFLFYFYARHKQTYWARRGVYSPPGNWLFGHFCEAFLLRASPPHILGELHKSCPASEPVLGFYILQKPFLLLRSAELVKQILIKDFQVFPDRYVAFKNKSDVIGSANLFSLDNPEWKYLRHRLSPAFSSGKLKKLYGLMLDSADNMRRHLSEKVARAHEDVTIEVREISSKYTTDVISSLSFGIMTNSFVRPEFYMRTRTIFEQNLARTLQIFVTFFFPRLIELIGGSFLGESDYFRSVFWDSMNEREKNSVFKRGDILDLLLDLKNEAPNSEFKFEGDYLVAQSAIFFVAGLETSAVTMSFTLLELAKYPDVQCKVRDELRAKLTSTSGKDHSDLSYELVAEMSYLQQVVSETLRLYPPAPIIDRVAIEDYKIPGTDIVIEKGTAVYAALKGIHEDPEYHPDPLKFDPDRFSETKKQDIKSCTYMPFGEGPRICIGRRIGMLQTMVGLITILRDYEVSLNPNYKNEVSKRAIFTAPSNGVHLNFRRAPVIS